MASQVLGAAGDQPSGDQPSAGQPVTERPARFLSGWRMLVLCIVVLLAGVALAVQAGHDHGGVAKTTILLLRSRSALDLRLFYRSGRYEYQATSAAPSWAGLACR